MARIDLDHIRHSYGPKPQGPADYALKEVDHTFRDGGAYALLGPSGCGKTTLLNIISGLVVPSRGRVLFGERDVTALGVRNLAGNVAEHVADRFSRYDEPCWSAGVWPLTAPRCDPDDVDPALPVTFSIRGGSWDGRIFRARAVERGVVLDTDAPVLAGFRCAASL